MGLIFGIKVARCMVQNIDEELNHLYTYVTDRQTVVVVVVVYLYSASRSASNADGIAMTQGKRNVVTFA